MLIEQYYY